MQKIVRDNLIAIVKAYGEGTGKSLTQVSKEFYGRGDFLAKFKAGKHSISIEKLDSMLEEFRANWPKGTDWPLTRPVFMSRVSRT